MEQNYTPLDREWYECLYLYFDEIWKDIKGYEGFYKVSNYGRICSLLFQNNVVGKKYKRFKILKPKGVNSKNVYKTGYRVSLWKNGECKDYLVARLVAYTFYDKDINDNSLTVDHLDCNRLNNNINNLELVTLKENIQRSFKNGLHNSHIKNKKCK